MNQVVGKPKGKEVHADMPHSTGDCREARMNLGSPAHPCNQSQTDGGPNRLQSLSDSQQTDSPAAQNRRGEIIQLARLKIEIRELMDRACRSTAERCVGSRQKDLPTAPQIQTGNEVGRCQDEERGEAER